MRLRPILMTSLATIIGLLPMAMKLGTGSEAYAPLARAIIGGMTALFPDRTNPELNERALTVLRDHLEQLHALGVRIRERVIENDRQATAVRVSEHFGKR